MFIYTKCRDCGGLLHVTDGDTVHPGCTPQLTRVERLGKEFVTLARAASERGGTDDRLTELALQITDLDNRPPRLREAALAYAGWGWPVFPLKPRAKTPATRNGFKDATTDFERIDAWWKRHPDSNIGLPTGLAFDVIDVDVPDGTLYYHNANLKDDPDMPDAHGHVATASGGFHLYVKPSGDGNRARLMPGIDYRGAGGYVVAPPSTLGERGRAWSWISAPSPVLTGAAA